MTRQHRIVLGLYGFRPGRYLSTAADILSAMPWGLPRGPYTPRGCYEAMDEPDEVPTVAPRIVLGGNYGLPCA